ncbi:MAG: hypothetical protein BJ554DRAFT_2730, partial [Olpidium bornovanus]
MSFSYKAMNESFSSLTSSADVPILDLAFPRCRVDDDERPAYPSAVGRDVDRPLVDVDVNRNKRRNLSIASKPAEVLDEAVGVVRNAEYLAIEEDHKRVRP